MPDPKSNTRWQDAPPFQLTQTAAEKSDTSATTSSGIIAAYLTLQAVLDENVDNLDDEADDAIENATGEFHETVGRILGV
ncbi:hypothetical protein [Paraburkholderia sp. MM6662-R1]|uniref:hypothetical protein n=1 Tax=Paraburkholderia sp. MM6662-R1 TaxID=2991066 RepID=UPI003D239D79